MITKKQINQTYKGRKFNEEDKYSTITTVVFDGEKAILLSGSYDRDGAGYTVEAVIDRNTGENITEGRKRPCDTKDDAVDVVSEML